MRSAAACLKLAHGVLLTFTRCKLSRASQVLGMRAQTFNLESSTGSTLKRVASYSTCMKRLRTHPRHLTRARQLASCKRGLRYGESPGLSDTTGVVL
jgi:hypothetical protein